MAQTIVGTQGTVSEAQWSELMSLSTQKYTRDAIASPTMLPNTTAPTSLRFPAYKSVGAGVLVKEDANVTVATPAGAVVGRWYLLVLRRTWGLTPTAALTWIATTSSTAGHPTSFPAGRQVIPGVTDDEPVGWYKHQSGVTPATWVALSNLADGTVQNKSALWDGKEQGFMMARSLADADAGQQWNVGVSEFFAWNPGASKWEARGSDTITIYREIPALVSNGTVVTTDIDITGVFEFPPFATPVVVNAAPQLCSVAADATSTKVSVHFYRAGVNPTTVRVKIDGIPKR